MSKLYIKIRYKDACILKHALRDKIDVKESIKNDDLLIVLNTSQTPQEFNKELSEEKVALERFTEQISESGIMHNRNVLGNKKK